MDIEPHEQQWLSRHGALMLRELGVQSQNTVLDFGCGKGRYTIPMTQAVGPKGRVFAVERTTEEIAILRERLAVFGDESVLTLLHTEDLNLSKLDPGSVDHILIFDVLQYIEDKTTLFTSLKRVLKTKGQLHIYPAAVPHPGSVDMEAIRKTLITLGFQPVHTKSFTMMHNKDMVTDHIHTFLHQIQDK